MVSKVIPLSTCSEHTGRIPLTWAYLLSGRGFRIYCSGNVINGQEISAEVCGCCRRFFVPATRIFQIYFLRPFTHLSSHLFMHNVSVIYTNSKSMISNYHHLWFEVSFGFHFPTLSLIWLIHSLPLQSIFA